MADYCVSVIDFLRLRVTLLDPDGTPKGGAANLYTTDKPVSLQMSPRFVEGTSSQQKDGQGRVCGGKTSPPTPDGYDLSGVLCQFEVELAQILFGGTLVLGGVAGAESIGLVDPDPTDAAANGVCVEAWAAAYQSLDEQANFPSTTTGLAYVQYCFPKVKNVRPGQETLQEGVIVQPWQGQAVPNPNLGPGPNNDWPVTPQGSRLKFLTNTLPTALCGASAAIS